MGQPWIHWAIAKIAEVSRRECCDAKRERSHDKSFDQRCDPDERLCRFNACIRVEHKR